MTLINRLISTVLLALGLHGSHGLNAPGGLNGRWEGAQAIADYGYCEVQLDIHETGGKLQALMTFNCSPLSAGQGRIYRSNQPYLGTKSILVTEPYIDLSPTRSDNLLGRQLLHGMAHEREPWLDYDTLGLWWGDGTDGITLRRIQR